MQSNVRRVPMQIASNKTVSPSRSRGMVQTFDVPNHLGAHPAILETCLAGILFLGVGSMRERDSERERKGQDGHTVGK